MRGCCAAAAAVILAMGGCGGGGHLKLGHWLATGRSAVTARYPAGWRATRDNDSVVPNPRLCFRVERGHDLAIKLVEYLPPLADSPRDHRPRPRRFRLEMLHAGDEDFSRGRILDFAEHGRIFFFGVIVPHGASGRTRRTIEAVMNSVRVGRGRCTPTGGPGSSRPAKTPPRLRP